MKLIIRLFRLDFVPRSPDLALLVLRLWIGLSMLFLHGLAKLTHFSEKAAQFPDPIGGGSKLSLALAVFVEVFCSALLVLGLFTRFAALFGVVMLSVAFVVVHNAAVSGAKSGELALIYLAAYVFLFLTGPGRWALDQRLAGKSTS